MKKIISVMITFAMTLSLGANLSALAYDDWTKDIFSGAPVPEFPAVQQEHYIIYQEGWRDNRLEMTVFNSSSNYSYVTWDGTLKLNENSWYEDDCKCYYDKIINKWIQFETGHNKISDHPVNVYASSLDVYKNGELYLSGTPYAGGSNNSGNSNSDITIRLNGRILNCNPVPIIVNDVTLVPLRVISEEMGYRVDWDGDRKMVTITDDYGVAYVLVIGSDEMETGGGTVKLSAAPRIINDYTMVPIRVIAEALQCTVDWIGATRTVDIYGAYHGF